jgi:hypothetical protein
MNGFSPSRRGAEPIRSQTPSRGFARTRKSSEKIVIDTCRYGLIRVKVVMALRIYSMKEAARKIGVAPITLKRWLLSHKVAEVSRDRNGWRIFTPSDIRRIKLYASARHAPERR